MNNELKDTLATTASALMHCTGSVATTVCDDNNGVVNSVTVVNVNGTDVVMVDPKAELAEIMEMVRVRKLFYKKALASLQRVYELEKGAKAGVKAGTWTKEDLADVMAQVMTRKKFFNRAAKSLQAVYVLERNHRTAMKIAKAK